MTEILQLVPRVPPAICGVGDQAWLLAAELNARHGIQSKFVFTDPRAPDPPRDAPFDTTRIGAGDAAALTALLLASSARAVIVHMSGYGYARDGAPRWLVKALAMVRRQSRGRPRVITMFHELYATGWILSRAFWTRFSQQRVLRGLIESSDCLRTNRRAYSDWISRQSGRKVLTMPVFSNLGETSNPPRLINRADRLVLLQPPDATSDRSRAFWQAWARVDAALRPGSTIAAGRSGALPPNVKHLGVLDAQEMAQLVRGSRYAFLDYFDGYLGKSTILAAVAAHGTPCILAKPNNSEADGLRQGAHYVTADGSEGVSDPELLQRTSQALWGWYQDHSLAATADSFAAQIFG